MFIINKWKLGLILLTCIIPSINISVSDIKTFVDMSLGL